MANVPFHPAPPSSESEAQRINRALAEAARDAEVRQADELPGGGRFFVDGVLVNAEGVPLPEEKG